MEYRIVDSGGRPLEDDLLYDVVKRGTEHLPPRHWDFVTLRGAEVEGYLRTFRTGTMLQAAFGSPGSPAIHRLPSGKQGRERVEKIVAR